jgi:hypothetical protein
MSIICATEKIETRTKIVQQFLKIMQALRKNKNYFALYAIYSGFSTSAVGRLGKTFRRAKINSKKFKFFREIKSLLSVERNSAAYRAALEASEPPTIPILFHHVSDLRFIISGNSKMSGNLINLRRSSLTQKVLETLESKKGTYPFLVDPKVMSLCHGQPLLAQDACYTCSLFLEPRNPDKVYVFFFLIPPPPLLCFFFLIYGIIPCFVKYLILTS